MKTNKCIKIKELKDEALRIEFEIANIIQEFEQKTSLQITGINIVTHRVGITHCITHKTAELQIGFNGGE